MFNTLHPINDDAIRQRQNDIQREVERERLARESRSSRPWKRLRRSTPSI